jgi:hypothetical protein
LYLAAGDGSATPLATAVIGTPATKDAVARTINSIDVVASDATGVKSGVAVQAVPGTAGSLAVAANNAKDTTVTLVATVKDNASTPAVVANAAFKVTVTSQTAFGAANSLTINGTTYVAAVPAALDATTDAAGKMTLTLKNATALTAGTVTLAIAGQNITNTVTVTYAAPVYVIRDIADTVAVGARTVAKGSTYAVEYSVLDQFGDAPADGKYRLINTKTGGNAAGIVYQNVVGGKATISTVDANTADATVTHTVNLQMFDTTTQNFITASPTVTDLVTLVAVKATTGAAVAKTVTIGTPVLGAGQKGLVTTLRLDNTTWSANYDARFSKATAPSLFKGYTTATGMDAGAAAGDGAVSLPIVVSDSTLAAATINAAPVTVTGKGLLFTVGSGATLNTATDSITFLDGSTTSVSVYSHTAGKQTVTVTSGAASKTVDLTFITVAAEASKLVMGTLAAQAQAGRSLELSATVTDKWDNAVEGASVAFSNTGVGQVVQSTAGALSTSTGKVSARLNVLQNDFGTSFLSATLDLATDVVVAKSIEFGLTDADVVAAGKRIFVSAEFAMGRTVTVIIDGKRVYSKVQTSDNAVELGFTQKKKGAHTVTVRVSGGIVFSERLITN